MIYKTLRRKLAPLASLNTWGAPERYADPVSLVAPAILLLIRDWIYQKG